MAKFHVEYTINEKALQGAIDDHIKRDQNHFQNRLVGPMREAARSVIYGNFMDTGPYNPRPIGKFTGKRARYHRGWVESNYGSQRAYQQRGGKGDDVPQQKHSFDHLRNASLLDAVGSLSARNPSMSRISKEARLAQSDPLAFKSGKGFESLRGYLGSAEGKKLTRKTGQPQPKGEMKYGVQTGTLARAWRDLKITPQPGLRFELHPALGSATGSPNARALTRDLARNKGWRGLADHKQLVRALEDRGIIVVNTAVKEVKS